MDYVLGLKENLNIVPDIKLLLAALLDHTVEINMKYRN